MNKHTQCVDCAKCRLTQDEEFCYECESRSCERGEDCADAATAPVISDEAVEAALFKVESIHHIHGDQCLCGFKSLVSRDRTKHIMEVTLEAAAPYMREAVTEWAAGVPDSAYPYNYYRTREEAQKFVDGMKEVGADMVVMTREVLPSKASEWIPATNPQPA